MSVADLEANGVTDRSPTTPLEMVTEFHRAFRVPIGVPWTRRIGRLRAALLTEECTELGEALLADNPLCVAQELADVLYVTLGAAVTLGIEPVIIVPAEPVRFELLWRCCSELAGALTRGDEISMITERIVWVILSAYGAAGRKGIDLDLAIAAVHVANMSKLGRDGKPITRRDGKVMKGPDFSPPDLTAAITPCPPPITQGTQGNMSKRSRSRAQDLMPPTAGE